MRSSRRRENFRQGTVISDISNISVADPVRKLSFPSPSPLPLAFSGGLQYFWCHCLSYLLSIFFKYTILIQRNLSDCEQLCVLGNLCACTSIVTLSHGTGWPTIFLSLKGHVHQFIHHSSFSCRGFASLQLQKCDPQSISADSAFHEQFLIKVSEKAKFYLT